MSNTDISALSGFRHALAGYASIEGVKPDFVVYGKAIANGHPLAAIGGLGDYMNYFAHPDPARRVLLAGTYNAHPAPTAAAIATIELLMEHGGARYLQVETLGCMMEEGLRDAARRLDIEMTVARQGSALCLYFMSHVPIDWHDLAEHHNFELDRLLRCEMVKRGIYFFPVPTKQLSISCAHTEANIENTLACFDQCLRGCASTAHAEL